jgi:selenium-binding protein 1
VPGSIGAWTAKIDVGPDGGIAADPRFFPHSDDFRGLRVHQTRLQGGDGSPDSYCYGCRHGMPDDRRQLP